jgi:hypothetical protein
MRPRDELIFLDMQNQIDTLRNQLSQQMRITLDLINILKEMEDHE